MKFFIFVFVLVLVASVTHDAQAGIAGKGREKRSKLFWQGMYHRIVQFKQGIKDRVQTFVNSILADRNRSSKAVPGTPSATTPPNPATVDPNASIDDMLKALEDLE